MFLEWPDGIKWIETADVSPDYRTIEKALSSLLNQTLVIRGDTNHLKQRDFAKAVKARVGHRLEHRITIDAKKYLEGY